MSLVCPLCRRPTVFGSFGALQVHFDTNHSRRSEETTQSSRPPVRELEAQIEQVLSRQLRRKADTSYFDRWTAHSSLAVLQQPAQQKVDYRCNVDAIPSVHTFAHNVLLPLNADARGITATFNSDTKHLLVVIPTVVSSD
uniref:Uncharacterized protein n=1 Tax=Plectus sambesii TaxID=2011161 RepID=A0A914ULI0_9BILA